ncbi:hypothetical protein [Microcoleus sp. Pol10D4]|uniref:hypothetical protein n=1 Tax=Microcoleus sp. Pol10D4 TaxID=3055387 RepID=UPI002FD77764
MVIGNWWVYEIVGFRQLFLVKPAPTGCKLPMPDAQFPMPHAQFSIPDAQFPMPNSPCPITKYYFGP